MNMMTIGSLNNYVKQAGMQAKVSLKKQSGNLQSHADPTAAPSRKTAEASMYQQQINDERENKGSDSDKLEKIMNKVYAGKKLTSEEREYLKAKDPETYERLKSVESEDKSYERELKRCKTKEEAQQLKLRHLNTSLTTVKSVENNPNIPEEKKLALVRMEKLRMDKIESTAKAFVDSGKYAKLPTEAEKAEAEQQFKAAREAEMGVETPETGKMQTEEEKAGQAERAEAEEKTAEAKEPLEAAEDRPDVETPEQRKVRQAKQRAAFAVGSDGSAEEETPLINVEA